MARPGEVLTYRVRVLEAWEDGYLLEAEATVSGQRAAEARLRFQAAQDPQESLVSGWREHRRRILSGEDPPIIR
jgi:hypothetical protein